MVRFWCWDGADACASDEFECSSCGGLEYQAFVRLPPSVFKKNRADFIISIESLFSCSTFLIRP